MKKLALVLLAVLGPSCHSYNVIPFGTFDQAEKTMTVGQGGDGLLGYLKVRLRQDGWKMAIDRGPNMTEIDGKTSESYVTFKTRYRLSMTYKQKDITIGGDGIYKYDISIVDNRTGEEVLTMSGKGVDHEIADRLLAAIHDNSK